MGKTSTPLTPGISLSLYGPPDPSPRRETKPLVTSGRRRETEERRPQEWWWGDSTVNRDSRPICQEESRGRVETIGLTYENKYTQCGSGL